MRITQDPKILDILIQNFIFFKTFSVKNPFPSQLSQEREELVKRKVKEMSHQRSSTIKRGVCKQLIFCRKEEWGPSWMPVLHIASSKWKVCKI